MNVCKWSKVAYWKKRNRNKVLSLYLPARINIIFFHHRPVQRPLLVVICRLFSVILQIMLILIVLLFLNAVSHLTFFYLTFVFADFCHHFVPILLSFCIARSIGCQADRICLLLLRNK